MKATISRRRLCQTAAGFLALFASGAGLPRAHAQPLPATIPPIAPGAARLWFYRVFFPDDTGHMPAISMNGAPIGYAVRGVSFYRDVPPGQYHLTVATEGLDVNQSQLVVVGPGHELYVKIASLPNWQESGRGSQRLGTYYVMLMSPEFAWLEMPLTTFWGGS